jgi:hypothetical protein
VNPLLEAALARAAEGAYVLPLWWTDEASVCQCPKGQSCPSPGKHPLLKHGLQEASTNSSTIERWWRRWPQANVGVCTDGVPRIDIDLPEVAEALAKDAALPNETEVVRTPRGGMHIAVRCTRPVQGGSLHLEDGRRLGDLKAAGGYVLVPPSSIGDRHYHSLSPDHRQVMTVDDPRLWLAEVLLAFGFALGDEDRGDRQYASLGGTMYEGEGRHNALVSYAGRVWVEGMSRETLAALLQVINKRQCQPPLPGNELSDIVDHFVARRERRGASQASAREHYSSVVSPEEHPRIVITNRHLHEIAEEGWDALLRCSEPPVLFQHGGDIAEVTRYDNGHPRITHLGLAALRGRLDRAAEWVRLTDTGDKPGRPPRDVVEDMDALPKPLPVLRGIIGTPTFAPDERRTGASGT